MEDYSMAMTAASVLVANGTSAAVGSRFIMAITYVGYAFVPSLLLLGLVGNSLTISVMTSSSFRHLAISRMLIFLSLSDTLVNLLFPFNKPFVRLLLGTDIRALSAGGCKLFFWAYRFGKMTSSWMVVLISFERMVAVCLPLKAKLINTTRHAYAAIAVVYVFMAVYIGYWCSWSDRIIGGSCIPNTQPAGLEMRSKMFLVVGLALYSFIPAVILAVLSTLIAYKLVVISRSRSRQVGPVAPTPSGAVRITPSGTSATVTILSVAIAFVVLVTPNATLHIVSFVKKQNIFQTDDPSLVAFREISQVMEQLNNSINFVLYILFSRTFRNGILVLFGKSEV